MTDTPDNLREQVARALAAHIAERAEAEVERLRGQLSLNRPTITDHEES